MYHSSRVDPCATRNVRWLRSSGTPLLCFALYGACHFCSVIVTLSNGRPLFFAIARSGRPMMLIKSRWYDSSYRFSGLAALEPACGLP